MHSPFIMVAPNGAHKTKQDHPNLPITIDETIATAIACHKSGAHGLHAHVRDEQGQHSLDSGLYLELIQELSTAVPELLLQITTEAVGRYSPKQQRDVVNLVQPKAVSVAIREMLSDNDNSAARAFYHGIAEQNIDLQHILYSDQDVLWLDKLISDGIIPQTLDSTLFVLGRYSEGQLSSPSDLHPFLKIKAQSTNLVHGRFMVCAFGPQEIECLVSAAAAGAGCRIGFENNIYKSNSQLATDNQQRVIELIQAIETVSPCSSSK